MPNMGELLNQILVEITRDRTLQLFISKNDLDYAYGQRNYPRKRAGNVYLQLPEQKLADIIDLKKGFTDSLTSLQISRRK